MEVDEDFEIPDGVVELKNGSIVITENLCKMVDTYLEQHPDHVSKGYLLSLVDTFSEHNNEVIAEEMSRLQVS